MGPAYLGQERSRYWLRWAYRHWARRQSDRASRSGLERSGNLPFLTALMLAVAARDSTANPVTEPCMLALVTGSSASVRTSASAKGAAGSDRQSNCRLAE